MKMIKKVEYILKDSFNGSSKQDAYLWLRERVPKTESKIAEINDLIKEKQVAATNIQSASQYAWSGYSAKMTRLLELDRKLKYEPLDYEGLDHVIRELNYYL